MAAFYRRSLHCGREDHPDIQTRTDALGAAKAGSVETDDSHERAPPARKLYPPAYPLQSASPNYPRERMPQSHPALTE